MTPAGNADVRRLNGKWLVGNNEMDDRRQRR